MESTLHSEISRTPVSNTPRSSRFGFSQMLTPCFVAIFAVLFLSSPASAVEKWHQPPDLSTEGIDIRIDSLGCEPNSVVCDDGTTSLIISYPAGDPDDFVLPIEAASPDPALLNHIVNCSFRGTPLQFDQIPGMGGVPSDSWFGHTFISLPVGIVGATLEFRARATTGSGAGASSA
ncbi:MAG: hypothetical protein IID32_09710 [Planctomycetes bacterium]|nr:hypothetical protein [Planctomycetota bacterium]